MSQTSEKVAKQKARRKKPGERRAEYRDSIWPDSSDLVWDLRAHDGFTSVPRVLPLVNVLIRSIAKARGHSTDPSSVYTDLWCRNYNEGVIEIIDEDECAYFAGYTGTRARRSWQERMLALVETGFIVASPRGNREYANILVLDPIFVCAAIHDKHPELVPEEWWSAFLARLNRIGGELPSGRKLTDWIKKAKATGAQL